MNGTRTRTSSQVLLGKRSVQAVSHALQGPDGLVRLTWLEREISAQAAEWRADARAHSDRDEDRARILDSCGAEIEMIIKASFKRGLGVSAEDQAEALERQTAALIDEVCALRGTLHNAADNWAYTAASA